MKFTMLALIAIVTMGMVSLTGWHSDARADDELNGSNRVHFPAPVPALSEAAPAEASTPQETPPVPAEASPSDVPVPRTHEVHSHGVYPAGATCNSCCRSECCCLVPTRLCLVDPCDGCSYEACVHLPSCCVGVAPVVEWRDGVLGRKIIDLCWPCCDKTAKVVVPVIGDVRVRE